MICQRRKSYATHNYLYAIINYSSNVTKDGNKECVECKVVLIPTLLRFGFRKFRAYYNANYIWSFVLILIHQKEQKWVSFRSTHAYKDIHNNGMLSTLYLSWKLIVSKYFQDNMVFESNVSMVNNVFSTMISCVIHRLMIT